ncbi:MAG: Transcriptional regulatory protein DegU [Planctomycetota bacterium]|jgi:DNA-binding NarL/FixJ family response regulator
MSDHDVIGVLIVDDHPLFREGLVHALGTEEGFRIVGEAADGQEALALWLRHRPDVTLVDVSMPGLDGISLVHKLRSGHPHAKVLMLTSSEDQDDVLAALDAGAAGYITKGVRYMELKAAIREVHAGGQPIGEALAKRLAAHRRDSPLTPREMVVLRMLSDGLGHVEIAERLDISERTARAHVAAIREKLGATNAAQAIAKAFARGLLATDR